MNLLQGLLGFNLFLQIFDGTASYFILSRGEPELNPFVSVWPLTRSDPPLLMRIDPLETATEQRDRPGRLIF